jgi:hypothetical protein
LVSSSDEVIEAEDEEAVRIAILAQMEQENEFKFEDFEKYLDQELSVFKEGEKYDYIKDIKDAYKNSLAKSQTQRIFETIPDHVFWDIKKPLKPERRAI